MDLYHIDRAIKEVIENGFSVSSDGELIATFDDLEALKASREEKIKNIALYMKEQTSLANQIKEEYKRLSKRAKDIESRVEKLGQYLGNLTEFETAEYPECKVYYRRSREVQITDPTTIPIEFMKLKQTLDPDKFAIRKAIESGTEIEGASLVDKQNLHID